MKITQHSLNLSTRTKLRLSEVERLIRNHRIIVPVPSRRALIDLCEDGTFETAPRMRKTQPWLIFEDSFLKWVAHMDGTA